MSGLVEPSVASMTLRPCVKNSLTSRFDVAVIEYELPRGTKKVAPLDIPNAHHKIKSAFDASVHRRLAALTGQWRIVCGGLQQRLNPQCSRTSATSRHVSTKHQLVAYSACRTHVRIVFGWLCRLLSASWNLKNASSEVIQLGENLLKRKLVVVSWSRVDHLGRERDTYVQRRS